ncbi:hypothetical protein G6514_006092 [Epicoccum nigrum]|nr:hypothetical protein G6514_006092 [Epicoccum nigrum]
MKTFAITSIIALASVATAQFDNIPSCALTCFIGPLTTDGCSALTDFACHCKQGAKLLATVQPCVEGACSAADKETTIAAVEKTCADAGAPIEIPDAPSASSAAPSSAVASSIVPSSAAPSSAAPSSAAPSSSAVSATPSGPESSASPTATATVSTPANGTASATPTPSEYTGAAAQATQAAGLLGAAALALLAL